MPSVLLIDDDAVSRELFSLLLEAEGYTVHACEDGEAALATLRSGKLQPDAVLSDMQMPGITGSALAKALRALVPQSVILGMSASGSETPSGFDGFLQKPFDAAQFTQTLDSIGAEALRNKSQQSHSAEDLDEGTVAPLAAAMPVTQLAQLYGMAVADSRKRVTSMRHSLAAHDDAAFRKEAHAIKGGAVMLGARAIAALARQMEEAGINADASRLLDELMAAVDRLESILLQRFPQ